VRKTLEQNQEIKRRARGKFHDAFSHVEILPPSRRQATIDLDAGVLADEDTLLQRRDELILSPLAPPIDFFGRRGEHFDE
jgi:hypothetical protein